MNFIKRAFKNVQRKKSKTILLALTFFLIGNLVIIGLGVSNASESAKILTRKKMRAVVTYEINYDQISEYIESIEDEDEREEFYKHYPKIELNEVSTLIKDSRVKTANAISTYMWYQDADKTLDFVHLGNQAEDNMENMGQQCWMDEFGNQQCETYQEPVFLLKTNVFPSMIEFEEGDYELLDGRFYTQEEIDNGELVCLVSRAFAETNGLTVGDDITLSCSYLSSYMNQSGVEQEDLDNVFEVIGIYDHHNQILPGSSNYDYCYPYENPDNMIFMPTTSYYVAQLVAQQKQFDYYATQYPDDYNEDDRPSMENMERNLYLDAVTLLLNDPLDVDAFVENYNPTLARFMKLNANNEEFNNLSKPLDTLSMYANFIIWLVVINAVVIITLVTALTLKTREYEIGVLLSIGASKIKIVAQFFVELAIIAVLGFTLAVGSGSIIAKQIGNKVLEFQIASSGLSEETEDNNFGGSNGFNPWDNDYTTEITLDDLISEYDVTISPLIIGEIYVLGLGIVLISVIIPSFMIMRYNPKMILMNQN